MTSVPAPRSGEVAPMPVEVLGATMTRLVEGLADEVSGLGNVLASFDDVLTLGDVRRLEELLLEMDALVRDLRSGPATHPASSRGHEHDG